MAVNCRLFSVVALSALALAGPAAAEPSLGAHAEASATGRPPDPAAGAVAAELGPRLHAQIELAALVLPTAGLLGADRQPTTGADVALPLGFHFHYRADRWALGATASLALFALTSSPYGGTPALPRTHERGFFQLAPEARYYLREGRPWELWLGGKAGLVMLADRYATVPGDTVPSNYGVKTDSVRSEGLVALVGGGGAWRMTELFTLGLDLRAGALALPSGRHCSPLGDCSSMSGVFPALELGLAFGILRDL